ncbi:toll/interleukin-1 receptor domain-containing protein [Shewanella algae]|uniref:toll/interleukin-1 receptor domain-containing protein n=1 Tax=Shewanella algae TaxID=38313 RepID=UPI001AADAC8C|nr:toll/interleukin-1 receptor domain-containing protein [Shewanella algae]MBO2599885.1 toll/interleukin-1 receptor domain-containing protein [Shewanella algae]
MIKAFLSHSSKDKDGYVRNVAKWLGKDKIIYDEFTFEEGEKPLNEILKGLDHSSLFVIFLSENALSSPWVQREIVEAKTRLDSDSINKIFPIIIDDALTYEDKRIPDWLRENYNLKPIKRAQVASKRIHNKLRELSWARHPQLKKRNTIFVGRNDHQESFEERIHDFDKEKPTTIMVSGFPGVGRRTFLHRALYKTNVTECSNRPSSILLDRNVSIEDFILKINDLGLIDLDKEIYSLSDKSIEEKIKIIHKVMDSAYNSKELIYLVDDGCIVNYERCISGWFSTVIESYGRQGFPIFCISSKYNVNFKNRPRSDKFYFVELNELNSNERKRLFNQLLDLYGVSLNKENFEDISLLLSGFPDQVMFAVDVIKDDPATKITDKMPLISDYNTDKASILLSKYEGQEDILDFIRLLAQFEVISSDFIFSLVSEEDYFPILERLSAEHIVELIGLDGEIIRLNDIVRDYIKRNRIKLNEDISKGVQKQVQSIIESDDVFERDSSEYIFTLKEALKSNIDIDEKLLIPSHYLRCMKDLYYGKGNLERIIELAGIILQKKDSLEYRVLQDIRYYLCLALAKKQDRRMLSEVQNIKGDEHTFLLGFYYRLCGRLKEALEKFESIVNAKYVSERAKREIVQVYVQLEEYDLALDYAKNNYEGHRGNQFHTQAYFNCLVNSRDAQGQSATLKSLIENLRAIDSEQSNEIADISEAVYLAKVEEKEVEALDKIHDCVDAWPDNHYPLLAMCDLAIKYKNINLLTEGVSRLREIKSRKTVSSRTFNKYQSYIYALNGNVTEAIKVIEKDLSRYPQQSKERIIRSITECAN